MSNNYQDWEDDDFESDDEETQSRSTDGKDLVQKLRKAQRAAEKRAKELESELNSLRSVQRETVIKKILEEKGLNPKVAAFIPATIETNEESLNQWIGEYGDVFGIQAQDNTNQQINHNLSTLRQIDAVTANALTPDKVENMMLRLDQATSAEEIMNMIYNT